MLKLSPEARQRIIDELARRGIKYGQEEEVGVERPGTWSKWCPYNPTPKQQELLEATELDILYGGAAGGAKSVGLLMWMVKDVERPAFRGIIARKTLEALQEPGALMDVAASWWKGTAARWQQEKRQWLFPSGATIGFKFLKNKQSLESWQGTGIWKIGIDESGQIVMSLQDWVKTRLRVAPAYNFVPQMLRTANPGGICHDELRLRFMGDEENGIAPAKDTRFIRSTLSDNPHLDAEEYAKQFVDLDEVTRAQLLAGDWDVILSGKYAKTDWFKFASVGSLPLFTQHVRFWDIAVTGEGDWTVGLLMAKVGSVYYVLDVIREQIDSTQAKQVILEVAASDPPGTIVAMEHQTLSIQAMNDLRATGYFEFREMDSRPETRLWLYGAPEGRQKIRLVGVKQGTRDKLAKASGFLNRLSQGEVVLVGPNEMERAKWASSYMRELTNFENVSGQADDQVDASGGAYEVARGFSGIVKLPKVDMVVPGSVEWRRNLIRAGQRHGNKEGQRRRR